MKPMYEIEKFVFGDMWFAVVYTNGRSFNNSFDYLEEFGFSRFFELWFKDKYDGKNYWEEEKEWTEIPKEIIMF
jgi:hypothetical protein